MCVCVTLVKAEINVLLLSASFIIAPYIASISKEKSIQSEAVYFVKRTNLGS